MITDACWKAARPICLAILLAGACFGKTTTAFAEERAAASGLAEAERAYQEVDFATMHDRATSALAAGGATRAEAARLNVLVGISAAALGEGDEARKAFIVALGVDPTLKLDRTLSPKIREPYLEAQGFWGAYPERLGLQAKAAADGEHLNVELVDPGRLASKVGLHVRVLGARDFELQVAEAKPQVKFHLPRDAKKRGYEYYASAADEHDNVLAEAGSEGDPRAVHAAPGDGPSVAAANASPAKSEKRSYFLPIALGVGGLAAVGVGVAFHLQREAAAKEWNGPGCEQPGSSRGQQCADVDSKRRFDEAMAIGAYTVGGLLLASSVVVLIVGGNSSSDERHANVASTGLLGCGPTGVGLSCAGRF